MNVWWIVLAGTIGVAAGAAANLCAELWSRSAPRISPWRKQPDAPGLLGRLPVVGWLVRRGAIDRIAKRRWLLPLFVELATGTLFAYMAWMQAQPGYLTPLLVWGAGLAPQGFPLGTVWHPADGHWLLAQWTAHALLMWLMLVASLIDFEEKLIPDEVTVPGTYLGLLLALVWPLAQPVGLAWMPARVPQVTINTITFPNSWPEWLDGLPRVTSLIAAIACFAVWYFALWPWLLRRGRSLQRGLALTCGWLRKHGHPVVLWWAPAVMVALIGVGWRQGGEHWMALMSSLFGMLLGGAFVWCMRVIASHVLQEEALGFGDVTLMAMIGSFLGWQACLMALFLSALLALVAAVLRLLILGDRAIYLGPFICLAAAWVVLRWPLWWDWAGPLFSIPWLVPSALLVCLGLLWFLLLALRAVKELLFRFTGDDDAE